MRCVAWNDSPVSYAELVRVKADRALRVPDGVDLDVAAALPLQGMTAHYLVELFAAVLDGTLNVRIGARFPLAEAAEAQRALEGRATTGKVILEIA